MACFTSINSCNENPCKKGVGGNVKVYLANIEDIASLTPTTGGYGIKDATLNVGAAGFYEFEVSKDTLGLNITRNEANGQVNYTQELSFTLTGITEADIEKFDRLSLSRLVAIVETRRINTPTSPDLPENIHLVAGWKNGLEMSAATGGTGLVAADLAGFQYTLQSVEVDPFLELVPDQTVYATNTPIAEFITTFKATC